MGPEPGQYISIDIPGQEAAELDFSVLNYSIMSSFVIGILPQTNITSFTLPDSMSDKNMRELVRVLPQTKITSLTLPNNMSSESVQALIQVLPETKIRNIIMPWRRKLRQNMSIDIPGKATDKLNLSVLEL